MYASCQRYLQLQVWCRLFGRGLWEWPGRSLHRGCTWRPRWTTRSWKQNRLKAFMCALEHGSLTGLLLVSSRVSFHALKRRQKAGSDACKWGERWSASRQVTYMDSSSLLAHRLTTEPSRSRTVMRFSRGLFSGGVWSAAHMWHEYAKKWTWKFD